MFSIQKGEKRVAFGAVMVVVALMLLSGSVMADSRVANVPPDLSNFEITEDRAIEIGLAEVGGGEVFKCEVDFENGSPVYDITILYEDQKYELDIDAMTGEIVEYEMERYEAKDASTASSPDSKITEEKAKEIALGKVGGGTVAKCKIDDEDGRQVYEITITYEGKKYEMDIDTNITR